MRSLRPVAFAPPGRVRSTGTRSLRPDAFAPPGRVYSTPAWSRRASREQIDGDVMRLPEGPPERPGPAPGPPRVVHLGTTDGRGQWHALPGRLGTRPGPAGTDRCVQGREEPSGPDHGVRVRGAAGEVESSLGRPPRAGATNRGAGTCPQVVLRGNLLVHPGDRPPPADCSARPCGQPRTAAPAYLRSGLSVHRKVAWPVTVQSSVARETSMRHSGRFPASNVATIDSGESCMRASAYMGPRAIFL